MAPKLNKSLMIRTLACDLELKSSDNPVGEISNYCNKQVKHFLVDFPNCASLVELLDIVANKVRTEFREIHTDQDLEQVRTEFLNKNETGFVSIHKELDGEVLGITLKRLNRKPWDLTFVSVIDCRGKINDRAYYTKWHELVHLLILTDQSRLVFRRTHAPNQPKSPEEALVDVVAGNLGFYPDMVRAHAQGEISFERIEELRLKLCPPASRQSALLGITGAWPRPCILLEARLNHKAGQINPNQFGFSFKKVEPPLLRAVHVTPNDAARRIGVKTIPNFRVPSKSIVYRVFHDGIPYAEAFEELSSWSSSEGARWEGGTIRVKAKNFGDSVRALLIPVLPQ